VGICPELANRVEVSDPPLTRAGGATPRLNGAIVVSSPRSSVDRAVVLYTQRRGPLQDAEGQCSAIVRKRI